MLEINVEGRLGNQMFQYATLRAMQEKKYSDKINMCFKNIERRKNVKDGWENALKYFDVKEFETLDEIHPSIIQKIVLKIYIKFWNKHRNSRIEEHNYEKRYIKILNFFGIYWLTQGYYDFKNSLAKNKLFFGYFESDKYFNNIREELLEEFTPKKEKLKKNEELYKAIENSNSVCVTIRRGDFIQINQVRDAALVCTEDYFYKAIEEMKKLVPEVKFFVFSDDIDWCKENMKFPKGTMYEDGTDPIWEKLRLMYSCKNFIISNSTFSWWAQYLSQNEKKIVIAPNKWRNYENKIEIYQDNWKVIDV